MALQRMLLPVALLMAGTLINAPSNADSKRPFRRLVSKSQPQRAAKSHQLKPERFKVKEPPEWVPQRIFPGAKVIGVRPDLLVKQYDFGGTKKMMRVRVANIGGAAAAASKLRLTIRRINGTPVGRSMTVLVHGIPANSSLWVTVDATKLLPNAVALQSTTFRLDADATNVIAEMKETNNTKWHNLP